MWLRTLLGSRTSDTQASLAPWGWGQPSLVDRPVMARGDCRMKGRGGGFPFCSAGYEFAVGVSLDLLTTNLVDDAD